MKERMPVGHMLVGHMLVGMVPRMRQWIAGLCLFVVSGLVLGAVGDWNVHATGKQNPPPGLPNDSLPEQRSRSDQTPSVRQERIHWYEWGEPAFERAAREDKLILLDLTAVWCHACHVMEDTTYSRRDVITLVNSEFIPIRVDTDQRPDIDARYRSGGWPTTVVIMHSGEVLFQANFLEPDELHAALQDAHALYKESKEDLAQRAARIWAHVEKVSRSKTAPTGTIDAELVDRSAAAMLQSFDPENGGFRESPKFFEPDAVTFAFLHAHRTGDEDFTRMALKTLDAQLRLVDPVWGGFYRYAEKADWSRPHYEKMLEIQATNAENYLQAYQATGHPKYKRVVEATFRYVERFLLRQDRLEFFSSQSADLRGTDSGRTPIEGERYFVLPERERLRKGVPHVDATSYTSSNGRMISAYLRAYQVLGDPHFRALALGVMNHVYMERYKPGRGMARLVVEGEPRMFGLLEDQVIFARALCDGFQTTGDRLYLQRAERLVADLIDRLGDTVAGGFYDRPQSPPTLGLLRMPYKPLETNLRASFVLSDLFYLTGRRLYRDQSEGALRFVLSTEEALPLALLGSAVDRVVRYPVHIVVVGTRADRMTDELLSGAFRLYAPGKIVRLLDPAGDSLAVGDVQFPKSDSPQAYICTDRFCSKPIADPGALEENLAVVLAA